MLRYSELTEPQKRLFDRIRRGGILEWVRGAGYRIRNGDRTEWVCSDTAYSLARRNYIIKCETHEPVETYYVNSWVE